MGIYASLRQRALNKRNKAIAAARAEYQACIDRILFLERRLAKKEPPPKAPKRKCDMALSNRVCEVLPRDRLFTVADVVEAVKASGHKRAVNAATVRTMMHHLSEQGILRRVSRGKRCVLWAAADFEAPDTEFGALPLSEVIERLIRERGPLTQAEMVVEMQAREYRPEADPRMLLNSVQMSLSASNGRFLKGKAGRWWMA